MKQNKSIKNDELYKNKTKDELIKEINKLNRKIEKLKTTNDASKNEKYYKSLFELIPLAYQSLDADGRFIDVNQSWLKTLGYTREEVIGKWFGFLQGNQQFATGIGKYARMTPKMVLEL